MLLRSGGRLGECLVDLEFGPDDEDRFYVAQQAGFGQLGGDRGAERLEAAVVHAGRGARLVEGATDVPLVDREPAAGGESQAVAVVEAVGCPLLLTVAGA